MIKQNNFLKNIEWPTLLISSFLLLLFIIAPFVGVGIPDSIENVINRFGMNAILVLSMIPMIQSGCGLNFGIPIGLISGILGATISIELNMHGPSVIFIAMFIGICFAVVFGYIYGKLLNSVKGDEMMIATYVGLSFVSFMNIMWLKLPYRNSASVQGFKGEGLRTTISLDNYWGKALNDFLTIQITDRISIPTGMILTFIVMALLVWLFFRTKIGTAMTAVGSNPDYARAAGININKTRVISVILSTCIAAVGIIVYEQSFGFVQVYNAPMAFVFPTIAGILLGGATVNKANMKNVIVGTVLFQGILTMAPTVINSIVDIDITEVLRVIVTNGMIVYALTRGGKK